MKINLDYTGVLSKEKSSKDIQTNSQMKFSKISTSKNKNVNFFLIKRLKKSQAANLLLEQMISIIAAITTILNQII